MKIFSHFLPVLYQPKGIGVAKPRACLQSANKTCSVWPQSAPFVPTMALLLFCCEIKKKLRVLLYTTFILTVFNAAATALFVHLILGASFSLLVFLNFVVICYCEAGIVKYQLKDIKISLFIAVILDLLHVLSALLLFIFASKGIFFTSYFSLYFPPLFSGKNPWSWSWAFTADDSFMFIPAFIHLIIITLTSYSVFFIWQLWKQISFNGNLERSPPNVSVPSISWTLEEHQAQCNLGYMEEDERNEKHLQIDNCSSVQNTQNNSEMLKEFECPVCFNPMLPPVRIFQCSLGHAICSACKSQGIEICPSCRKLITGRAHNMENIARLLFANVK